jgi:hypothetical protein
MVGKVGHCLLRKEIHIQEFLRTNPAMSDLKLTSYYVSSVVVCLTAYQLDTIIKENGHSTAEIV